MADERIQELRGYLKSQVEEIEKKQHPTFARGSTLLAEGFQPSSYNTLITRRIAYSDMLKELVRLYPELE